MTKKIAHGNVKFMEHWTPWNWIAYGCIGISAFGIAIETFAQRHPTMFDWLPTYLKNYMGYVPAILFTFATIIFIIQLLPFGKATKVEKAPPIQASTPAQSTTELIKPKKFYSDREKSDLANALRDLSEILSTEGTNITQKAQQISVMWTLESRKSQSPDTAALIVKLNDLNNLTVVLNRSLYNEGFMNKYKVYSDELNPILQIQQKPPNSPTNPISILQESIRVFRDGISSIDIAKKYNDQQLINSMKNNLNLVFTNYVNEYHSFGRWLTETQKRIDTFRNSQL